MMKTKFFGLSLLISLAVIVLSGCTNETKVNGITLDSSSLTLLIGDSHQFVAELDPADASARITWESKNPDIASVSDEGLVTAISKGSTQVVARCGSVSTVCNVSVSGGDVKEIKVLPDKMSLVKSETAVLEVVINPETADDKTVIWESSNPEIAAVDESGMVMALAQGEATITAKSSNGLSSTCLVTVLKKDPTEINIDVTELDMKPGDTHTFKVTVTPEDADYTLEWSSSDDFVASVDAQGTLTANRSGKAVITVAAGSLKQECEVNISKVGPEVGDYYYSDGTYSSEYDGSKTAIGLIYWLGDPTDQDPELKKDHPECKNGLVVALKGFAKTKQMTTQQRGEYMKAYPQYGGSVSKWGDANVPQYQSIFTSRELNSNLNKRVGYNNTKVFEAFNAAEENAGWTLTIVDQLKEFRESVPAPEETSGWYIPSSKELSLFTTGDYDGNISEINKSFTQYEQGRFLNEILSATPGADIIPDMGQYPQGARHWTSGEVPFLGEPSIYITTITELTFGGAGSDRVDFKNYTRFILAF